MTTVCLFPPPLSVTKLTSVEVKTFDDYNGFLPAKGVKPGHIFDRMIPPDEVRAKLAQIKGHLVWMPMEFLKDAPMAERGLQVNSWTESVYT
jgi:phospholipase D1/2